MIRILVLMAMAGTITFALIIAVIAATEKGSNTKKGLE